MTLGAYTHDLNLAMHDSTTSTLVMADQVSALRFNYNKFRAVPDLLWV